MLHDRTTFITVLDLPLLELGNDIPNYVNRTLDYPDNTSQSKFDKSVWVEGLVLVGWG